MPEGIARSVVKAAGGTTQSKIIDSIKSSISGGISGGSTLVAGPDARSELSIADFNGSFATIATMGANFVVNGVSFGVVIFSKKKPVLTATDMIYAGAIGVMGGLGLATSLDVEASGMVYRMSLG